MNSPQKFFLKPMQIFISSEEVLVTTILGSCIAICLWDPVTKTGGINHYMLPFWNGRGLASPKYGNIAIEKLIEKMLERNCNISNIKAKVFGGGDILGTESKIFNIGVRNIELAETLLKEKGIEIIAKSVGGKTGRKIQFCTKTGKVMQKLVGINNCESTK